MAVKEKLACTHCYRFWQLQVLMRGNKVPHSLLDLSLYYRASLHSVSVTACSNMSNLIYVKVTSPSMMNSGENATFVTKPAGHQHISLYFITMSICISPLVRKMTPSVERDTIDYINFCYKTLSYYKMLHDILNFKKTP